MRITGEPIRHGPKLRITKRDIDAFTRGSCYQLAEVISRETGWPLYSFWDAYINEYDIHMFVKTPRHTFLDVTGEHTRRQMLADWDARHIRKVRKNFDTRIWDFGNPYFDSTPRAYEILPLLLARYEANICR